MRQARSGRAALIESCESRRLLAATLTDGLLSVVGTAANDAIRIYNVRGGEVVVSERVLPAEGQPSAAPTLTRFQLADITSIKVEAGEGNDRVDIRVGKPGATERARPDGVPTTVLGGAGNDRIFGNFGVDLLQGGDGNDLLDGRAGSDVLEGGLGNDRLIGGRGMDTLRGGAGNDFIDARDRQIDTIDGGENLAPTEDKPGDVARADRNDVVSAVEKLLRRGNPNKGETR